MLWRYRTDINKEFELRVSLCCPQCSSQDLYVNYADYNRAMFTCNQCGNCFRDDEGVPNKKVAMLVEEIRSLIKRAHQIENKLIEDQEAERRGWMEKLDRKYK